MQNQPQNQPQNRFGLSKIVVALVLADFAALHVWALWSGGAEAIRSFVSERPNEWVFVLGADLVIALGMVTVWLWRDARQHRLSPIPYTLITLCTGSIGPLLYLLRRPVRASAERAHEGTATGRRLEAA